MQISRLNLAWAAGLIDGEGCISLTRRMPQKTNGAVNPNYRLVLKVTMCHEETILLLHRMFGLGTVQSQKQSQSYWSKPWTWFCNATDAEKVLKKILPYMITKREEAEVALKFLSETDRNRTGKSRSLSVEDVRCRDLFFIKLRDLKSCNQSKVKRKIHEAKLQRKSKTLE